MLPSLSVAVVTFDSDVAVLPAPLRFERSSMTFLNRHNWKWL
jgi:hypothetical protein